MQAQKLSSNSWHLWLANFGVPNKWDIIEVGDRLDICSYIRRVAWGLLKVVLLTIALIGILYGVLFSIGNLIGWLFFGYILAEPVGVFWGVVLMMALIVLVGVSVKATSDKVKDVLYKNSRERRNKQPGFLVLAYRKFKDKTCFMVEVE